MDIKSSNFIRVLLIITILIGAFFRFYKLDWGQSFYFHPDEYHIIISVNQLSFPDQMHPNFFSYGTVIIYLIYFTKEALSFFCSFLSFATYQLSPFLIGRFYAAFFSTLTIIYIYKISRIIFQKPIFALISALLVSLTPGLIQQAHFLTPESALIFFTVASLYCLLLFYQHKKIKDLFFTSLFFGLSIGVKISSLYFIPVIFLTIIFIFFPQFKKIALGFLFSAAIILITLFISDPYIFLDFPAFKSNIEYEGGLAAGNFIVFYTRQFIDTLPLLFQFEKIYPYALGPVLIASGLLGFILMLIFFIKDPKKSVAEGTILLTFLLLFIPNAFLFAKWTRFISPTFPFFAIFTVFLLDKTYQFSKKLFYPIFILILITSSLYAISFFTIYAANDVRITASLWLEENISPSSLILVEGGNMIDVPLNSSTSKISLNFYDFENNPTIQQNIMSALKNADYFILESRRVFMNVERLPEDFPKTANFYNKLFNGELGYQLIKEFRSYPTIPLLNKEFPDEEAEETWSVFDHPVIRVFKKIDLAK